MHQNSSPNFKETPNALPGPLPQNGFPHSGMEPSTNAMVAKLLLDLVASLVGIVFFAFTFPFIALLIKLDSKGPILYKQLRVGINRRNRKRFDLPEGVSEQRKEDCGGKRFWIDKYRTMRTNAEALGPQLCATDGDPRVTRVGKWLRALHLDETAQFLNLMRGDMSLIGPRPERPHYTSQYGKVHPHYSDRTHHIKPGLTGLAQIILGYDESEESVVRKCHYDLSYRASFSSFTSWFRMETWIFLETFRYLLQRPNVDGVTRDLDGLRRAKMLPFLSRSTELVAEQAKVSVSFKNSHQSRILVGSNLREIYNQLDCLELSDRCSPEIFVHSQENLDLADIGLLVELAHRAKHSGGRLWVICPNRNVYRILREIRLETVAELQYTPQVKNFLTIDVECWFHAYNLASKAPPSKWHLQNSHIEKNVEILLELLQAHRSQATFFVLGWVADHFPEVVRMIDKAGHEIGTHGYHHRLITGMTPMEFEADLQQSLEALGRLTSQKIAGHRASNFTVVKDTLWAFDILSKNGIQYDSSVFPFGRSRYGISNYPNRYPHTLLLPGGRSILELPMSTMKVGTKLLPVAGGGYLRLYPHQITETFIARANRRGLPVMAYLHPWELDLEQKRHFVGFKKTFQHYVNMDTTRLKLDRLLHRFPFTSVRDGLKNPRIQSLLRKNPLTVSGLFENEKIAASTSAYLSRISGESPFQPKSTADSIFNRMP